MLRQFAIGATLILFLGAGFRADTHRSSLLAQGPSVLQLSPEQRRAIQLSISATGKSSDFSSSGLIVEKTSFQASEPIYIRVVMTNTGREPAWVCSFSNPYYQNRPQLKRDGETVGYSENIREVIRQSDAGTLCVFTRSPDIVNLKPNAPLRVPDLELKEWYGSLIPGHYQLVLKRTFACCADGQWNSTNVISFDVTR